MARFFTGVVIVACLTLSASAENLQTTSRPDVRVPFPPIKDWSSLHIRLERTPCYGWCPAYSVEITADGSVTWFGRHYVEAKGGRSAQVPPEKVRALYAAFVKADFFWTFDKYEAPITDLPTHVISISYDGREKTIVDYAGTHVGMPKAIDDLEEAVDTLAGTKAWIGQTREP